MLRRVSWISAISHLLWYGARLSTGAILSKTGGSSVIYSTGVCLPTPSIAAHLLVSQKEAFPLYFFGRHLFLAFSSHEQLTRGTTGPASVWRFPKNSDLLIKISPNNDSFKPKGYNWKIRHDNSLSVRWWSLNKPVVGQLRIYLNTPELAKIYYWGKLLTEISQPLSVKHALKFKYMSAAILNKATGITVSVSRASMYKTNILSAMVG